MDKPLTPKDDASRAFERKVRRTQLAAMFEAAWLRLWLLLALAAAFLVISYAGLWETLPRAAHVALLGSFGLALFAIVGSLVRIRRPSREDAIRRIERISGVPHRPASSYEDTLSASSNDPATRAIWDAHKQRMARMLGALKAGQPEPRTDKTDPFALRAAALLAVGVATAFLGTSALERVKQAFDFSRRGAFAEARLDAWIAPPPYTGRPPVMLADGAGSAKDTPSTQAAEATSPDAKAPTPEVPSKSSAIVRGSSMGGALLSVEFTPAADPALKNAEPPKAELIEAEAKKDANEVQEIRYELSRSGTLKALAAGEELASWQITVTPDELPKISLSRPPELTPRGSLKITYKAEDDFGVAAGEAKLKRAPEAPRNEATDWAKPDPLTGPRLPLSRPPVLQLKLPKANAKEASGHTYFEFASHPWAGQKVVMTLEATDVAGQIGRSVPFEMILPERQFTKPLARAVVEQRKKLITDDRYRPEVIMALEAITYEPEGFIDDASIYLNLRSVVHRLGLDDSRQGLNSAIDQLWQIALRIEDGTLSDAERRVKDAQDKLAKALEDGASDEEIKQAMQELRQAFNDYMKQMAEQNAQNGKQPEGQNQDQQTLGEEDLERMMKNLEDMAENGSREQAQAMLNEMQDLMERLQNGQQNEAQQKQNQQMMQAMEELGDMVGDQQKLMDDTFNERRGDEEGQEGQQGGRQKPPPGMKGMGGDGREGRNTGAPPGQSDRGQRGQKGQQGQGGQAQQGQQGQGGDQQGRGQGQSQGGGKGSLSQRQKELRERLSKLQQEMRDKGMPGSGSQLGDAESAMQQAEDALEQGDLSEANEQQNRALDQMRQSAQQMAQQLSKNSPQRYGQSGDTPRDPLGRPQKSQGPDLGTSVKVPDEIDIQRAREILEELRRRLGETSRGATELDYLERLLRRF